jgi:6-phosphofructokinase 1
MTPSNYAIVTVTNGSRVRDDKVADAQVHAPTVDLTQNAQRYGELDGLESSGNIAARLLQSLTGEEVFFQQLTYLMRTGAPDGQDLLGAINFGMQAANLVQQKAYGRMVAFQRNHAWTAVELRAAMERERIVDVGAWYDDNVYRPTDGLIWSASIA